METICLKCLAKEPERRYATCQLLADDLRRFESGEPILARRQSRIIRWARAAARRPILSTVVAAAICAIAAGGLLVVRAQRDRQVNSLLTSLESQFDAGDWSAWRLDGMDGGLRLQQLSPQQAAISRATAYPAIREPFGRTGETSDTQRRRHNGATPRSLAWPAVTPLVRRRSARHSTGASKLGKRFSS